MLSRAFSLPRVVSFKTMFGKRTRAPAGGKEHFERKWAHFVIYRLRKDPAEVLRELDAAVKWANVAKYPLYTTYAFVAMRGGFSALKSLELAEFFERFVLRRAFPDACHKLAFEVGMTLLYKDFFLEYEKCHPEDVILAQREHAKFLFTSERKKEKLKQRKLQEEWTRERPAHKKTRQLDQNTFVTAAQGYASWLREHAEEVEAEQRRLREEISLVVEHSGSKSSSVGCSSRV